MNIGFQIDEIEKLNFKNKSSLPIILESQKRKNKNFYFLPSTLTYKNNHLYAQAREIFFKNNKLSNYIIGNKRQLKVDRFDYVFIRQDPPYNMEYIISTSSRTVKESTKFINNPNGIRNAPEKISMLSHKKIIPETIITRSKIEVKSFIKKYGKSVIKPLYGNGGESIFLLDQKMQIIIKLLRDL